GFAVLTEDDPVGPDHELADEEAYFADHQPTRLLAVRDLDLIAEDTWPDALRLLASEPDTWHAVQQPDGYTAWWLARHARLAGHPRRRGRRGRGLPGAGPPLAAGRLPAGARRGRLRAGSLRRAG